MMTPLALDALLAVLHHVVIFALVACLAMELALLRGPLDRLRLWQLARIDAAYGASSGLALLAGGLRVVYGAKGGEYYMGQPFFWVKLALFVGVGLLSIAPTVRIARWRRAGAVPDDSQRAALQAWLHGEAVLLAGIPVAAVLMARSVGG